MKLKIWHNSNFGQPAFEREVSSVEIGAFLLDLLADYDLYLGEKVVANAQGLMYYDEQDREWLEWYNDEGEDISEIRDKALVEANKMIQSLNFEGGFYV